METVMEMIGPLIAKCGAIGIFAGVLTVGLAEALCAVLQAFKRMVH